jgi:hypothetical protein
VSPLHPFGRTGTIDDRPTTIAAGTASGARRTARRHARREARRDGRDDSGLTLVELLVSFSVLSILLALVATSLSTYLTAGNTVLSSYNAIDSLLPTSVTIQRLVRSEVEPAPTPVLATQVASPMCPLLNAPCPPFVVATGSTPASTASTATFYANVGAVRNSSGALANNGPAKIVMSASTPGPSGCTARTCTSDFTVTQQGPDPSSCPTSATDTKHCTYTTMPVATLVDLKNVINGVAGTNLKYASTPIFTYNTLDPYSAAYVAGVNYAPNYTGLFLTSACLAPTVVTVNGVSTTTASNCPADNIESVGVDLMVRVSATAMQENSFVVYRLSSTSNLYTPPVG